MSSTEPKPTGHRPTHLEPSELGTKEYWESLYENSLTYLASKRKSGHTERGGDEDGGNAENGGDKEGRDDEDDDEDDDDDDDPGTSWFSEYKAPEKVLRFLTSDSFPLAPCNMNHRNSSPDDILSYSSSPSSRPPTILDLGTGNGSMLTHLRDQGGFTGPMVGVDYSPKSIELARHLASRPSLPSSSAYHEKKKKNNNIRFEVWDILHEDQDSLSAQGGDVGGAKMPDWFPAEEGGFDIVLDKGTFDAVSLSAEEIEGGEADDGDDRGGDGSSRRRIRRRICERYPSAAVQLVRPGGFLVVTSCNWTEEELVKWFTDTGSSGEKGRGLIVWDRIAYTKFRFGGQEGQGVCTVCFQRLIKDGI